MSETQRLERIQTITRYFPFWQGLKIVPVGVFLLIMASIYHLDTPPLWSAIYVVGLSIFVFGTGWINRWYRRLFGVVSNPKVNQPLDRVSYLVLVPAIVVGAVIDAMFQLPVSFYTLALAGGLLWARHATGGGRPHYFWVAGTMIAAAFLPAILGDGSSTIQLALAVMGAGSILIGILDHLELTRIFKPIKEETNAPA